MELKSTSKRWTSKWCSGTSKKWQGSVTSWRSGRAEHDDQSVWSIHASCLLYTWKADGDCLFLPFSIPHHSSPSRSQVTFLSSVPQTLILVKYGSRQFRIVKKCIRSCGTLVTETPDRRMVAGTRRKTWTESVRWKKGYACRGLAFVWQRVEE